MISFKEFIAENEDKPDEKTEWMSGKELAKHVPKTAIKHISKDRSHEILRTHNVTHGGSGDLAYRIHTSHYGNYKKRSVQAASNKKDKDGYTHHATYDLHGHSATLQPGSHLKTHAEKKLSLPWHTSSEDVKKHEESHKRSNGS